MFLIYLSIYEAIGDAWKLIICPVMISVSRNSLIDASPPPSSEPFHVNFYPLLKGRGGGQVVSVPVLDADDPSSNPTEVYSLIL